MAEGLKSRGPLRSRPRGSAEARNEGWEGICTRKRGRQPQAWPPGKSKRGFRHDGPIGAGQCSSPQTDWTVRIQLHMHATRQAENCPWSWPVPTAEAHVSNRPEIIKKLLLAHKRAPQLGGMRCCHCVVLFYRAIRQAKKCLGKRNEQGALRPAPRTSLHPNFGLSKSEGRVHDSCVSKFREHEKFPKYRTCVE